MKNLLFGSLFVLFATKPIAPQQIAVTSSKPFVTDGCTFFPQGNLGACCVQHDYDYWKARTWSDLLRADNGLFGCVWHTHGVQNKTAAGIMWVGVKFAGLKRWRPLPHRKDDRETSRSAPDQAGDRAPATD